MAQKGERIRIHSYISSYGLEGAVNKVKRLVVQYRREVLNNKELPPHHKEALIRSYIELKKFLRTRDVGDDIYERQTSQTYQEYCKSNGISPRFRQVGGEGTEEVVQEVRESGDTPVAERLETTKGEEQ